MIMAIDHEAHNKIVELKQLIKAQGKQIQYLLGRVDGARDRLDKHDEILDILYPKHID
jgi:hypothetical protein